VEELYSVAIDTLLVFMDLLNSCPDEELGFLWRVGAGIAASDHLHRGNWRSRCLPFVPSHESNVEILRWVKGVGVVLFIEGLFGKVG
jgi:hypothetical protein